MTSLKNHDLHAGMPASDFNDLLRPLSQHYEAEDKRIRTELARACIRNEVLLDAIPSFLIAVSPDQRIVKWNLAAVKTFGIRFSSVKNQPFQACGIDWEWNKINTAKRACISKIKTINLERVRFTRPDGREAVLGINLSPLDTNKNTPCGFLVVGADISERVMLEDRLMQIRKMESIGRLAAGIAHEINTPTQYIGDNTRFLGDSFNELRILVYKYQILLEAANSKEMPEEYIKTLEQTIEQTDLKYLLQEIPLAIEQTLEGIAHVAKIVRAMKDFSHPGTARKIPGDINKIIENAITVTCNEWKYVANIKTDLDHNLPPAHCFPEDLQQVFMNLIINSANAIEEKRQSSESPMGTITIRTRRKGTCLEIRIEDTGIGIEEKDKAHIFDPFFTTKEVGKGTGQGLALCHAIIVEKHGGTISVESKRFEGTAMIICFPMETPPLCSRECF